MRPSTSNLEDQERNWLDLPSDITANILLRIGTIDILKNAQKVCTVWRKICKDPSMWKLINMKDLLKSDNVFLIEELCKHLIDRSQGQLDGIAFVYDDNDALLRYVADRSSVLRHLLVAYHYGIQTVRGLNESLMKFPLLEGLYFDRVAISKETIETVGCHCPKLKILKMNQKTCRLCVVLVDANEESLTSYNEIAIAIGGSLHELRHLELQGNKMSNVGLQVILDGCRHLETLDLRECFFIDLNGNPVTECLKQINNLKLPTDSLECDPHVCVDHDYFYDDYETLNSHDMDYDGCWYSD